MAKKSVTPKRAKATSGGIWSTLGGLLSSPTAKQILTVLLSILAGGAAVGYAAKTSIENAIPHLPLPRIPKILPRPWKAGDAIVQTRFGNAGCSATIIEPDCENCPYVDLLTAAHCMKMGATGEAKLKDGRILKVKCVAHDSQGDVAWLRADRPADPVPTMKLAVTPPPPGTKIWHMGYGTDKPGNKEEGHVAGVTPDGLKVQYRLSVSPGDSGGGIIATEAGEVISPVCCTSKLAGLGDVWGGTPARARAIRPPYVSSPGETLAVNPMMTIPEGKVDVWDWRD